MMRPGMLTESLPNRVMTGRWWIWAALVLVTWGAQVGLSAQEDESRRIIQLGEEVVEGRIEKPEAFYILQPTNLTYETVALEESFIPELLRTVEEPPF